jgi:nucleoid DNA-binding protein
MPTTLSQAALLNEALDTMEDDLRVSKRVAKDLIESLTAVVEEHLENGEKVALLGLAILTPVYRAAKPKRKGVDPRTGEERMLDARPAKIALKATPSKRLKDALPSPTAKAGKTLALEFRERQRAREARQAEAEKEVAKAAKKGGKKK